MQILCFILNYAFKSLQSLDASFQMLFLYIKDIKFDSFCVIFYIKEDTHCVHIENALTRVLDKP